MNTFNRLLTLLALPFALAACDPTGSEVLDSEVVALDDAQLLVIADHIDAAQEPSDAAQTEQGPIAELDIDIGEAEPVEPESYGCDAQRFVEYCYGTGLGGQQYGAGQCVGAWPMYVTDHCVMVDYSSPCFGFAVLC